MKIDVLGIKFDNVTKAEAVSRALECMSEDGAKYVVTPNPEIVWMCRKNQELSEIISGAELVLADGIGIIHGAKILGRPLKEKIPGIDFAEELLCKMAQENKSVFLFGAKAGVADKAAESLETKFPGIEIAGTENGFFKDDAPIVEKINAAAPDLLLVCLGAPKQEVWMKENAERLNVRIMIGLGGSLDVFAGTVERAPERWQKAGLEWLYRLLKEPKRIKRMIKLPLFLFVVIWHRIRGK